jgi:hypothetical protein
MKCVLLECKHKLTGKEIDEIGELGICITYRGKIRGNPTWDYLAEEKPSPVQMKRLEKYGLKTFCK